MQKSGPIVVLESFARNVPVIAFGIPAILEKINNRKSGLIAVPFSTEDFSNKVLEFTTNYSLRMELNLGDKKYLEQNYNEELVYTYYKDMMKSFE